MSDGIENLILEHLKKIWAEQSAARERDMEILARLDRLKLCMEQQWPLEMRHEQRLRDLCTEMRGLMRAAKQDRTPPDGHLSAAGDKVNSKGKAAAA